MLYIIFRKQSTEDFICVKFRCYLNAYTFKYRNGLLTYKYTVYTNQVTKEDTQFEYLHETESGYTDRELYIPNNECKPNGMWLCIHTHIWLHFDFLQQNFSSLIALYIHQLVTIIVPGYPAS